MPDVLVPSSDGVHVVVHDLGGTGPVLLMSHATGFHGRAWLPVARHLRHRFSCRALDYRGHGDTAAPIGWQVDWEGYGDDAVAVANALAEPGGIIGIGHSMGGACLLMAAQRDPSLFRGLVLFEPIVFPTDGVGDERPSGEESPLAIGARRRRPSFPSYESAIAHYSAKPPLGAFTTEALEAYVHGGFSLTDDGHVHLKCRPEHESATFASGGLHRTWDVLGDVRCPTVVVAGRPDPMSPAALASRIAELLPAGRYRQLDELDHFGPMTHPEVVATLVEELADSLDGAGRP